MSSIDFSQLMSKRGGNMKQLQATLEKNGQSGFKRDERLWKPQAGKAGTCECVVRFLPISKADMELVEEGKFLKEDLTPMAQVVKHWFKGPDTGKNYIEISPQTFGDPCPVLDHDIPLLAQTKNLGEKEKKIKRTELGLTDRRGRVERYANVLIIKDSTNPENEGKVMIWNYGAEIQKKIDGTQEKKFTSSVIFDPFCPWEGADLVLNLEFEEKDFGNGKVLVPDYKAATWAAPAPLGTDEEIKEIWEKQHALLPFMNRADVKDYDTLQKKFFEVMNYDEEGNPKGSAAAGAKSADDLLTRMQMGAENAQSQSVSDQTKSAPEQKSEPVKQEPATQDASTSSGGELDDFEALLAEATR